MSSRVSDKTKLIKRKRYEKYMRRSSSSESQKGFSSGFVKKMGFRNKASSKRRKKHSGKNISQIESDVSDYSPIKTRGFIKNRAKIKNRCRMCRSETGPFMACAECLSKFHLNCLGYSSESAEMVSKRRAADWQCPMCVLCSKCFTSVYDAGNVQCSCCDRTYHASCAPDPPNITHSLKDSWYCPECKMEPSTSEIVSSETIPTKGTGRRKSFMRKNMTDAWSGEDSEIQKKRNKLNDSLKDECAMRITENKRLESIHRRMEQENCSPKKCSKNNRSTYGIMTSSKVVELPRTCKTVNGIKVECLSEDEVNKLRRMDRQASEARMKDIAILSDYENYKTAKAGIKKRNFLGRKLFERQIIHFGFENEFEAPHESSYPKFLATSAHLYVCQFCLIVVEDEVKFESHLMCCEWQHPPGNEIYRDGTFSFWEIDGELEKSYCQRLCLFAKLFLSSKTLHREVEMFLFYLLTKYTTNGCVMLGYFSKEKSPSKNNNLSCILTLPSSLRCGYGRYLIDLSYKLSLRERKIGGPEHPLSDLGVITYRGYWKAVLFSYIKKCRPMSSFSLKGITEFKSNEMEFTAGENSTLFRQVVFGIEMTYETGIHPQDIVSTLRHCRMLNYRGGSYFIDVKKAYMAPLKSLRRRAVKDELLVWEPEFEVDNEKMGNYASNKSIF